MAPASHPGPDDPDDAAALAAHATALADGIEAALPGWVRASVADRHAAARPGPVPAEVEEAAREAGEEAARQVGPAVRALLARDVDDQPTGPLALVRGAVRYPTAVLAAAGVPPVVRDEVAERINPDDTYDLAPAAFADVHPDLHGPGIVWGAAKAHVVLARRRREGRR
ncbi:hypothetical protein PO878_03600 [Iamia majanohamensis]|uniref:Uncharacterized protein n=1 Tax=Iamia majanohamensis TaxID=467976 RepID=A0AAF0BUG2_9ACTN|nr:hypothetical protein [Iamia majanohamensis]WCO67807.1 hypothetical protein PO878_03600 [Iamia majanohamensis]